MTFKKISSIEEYNMHHFNYQLCVTQVQQIYQPLLRDRWYIEVYERRFPPYAEDNYESKDFEYDEYQVGHRYRHMRTTHRRLLERETSQRQVYVTPWISKMTQYLLDPEIDGISSDSDE